MDPAVPWLDIPDEQKPVILNPTAHHSTRAWSRAPPSGWKTWNFRRLHYLKVATTGEYPALARLLELCLDLPAYSNDESTPLEADVFLRDQRRTEDLES